MSVPTDHRYWEKALYIYSKPYAESFQERINQIKSERNQFTYQDFADFDTLHPAGHYGVERLVEEIQLGPQLELLDVGSGLGGPSRFLNEKTGIRVYGVDIIEHFVELSNQLAGLMQKQSQLEYHAGDVLDSTLLPANRFDAAYSIATILVYIADPSSFVHIFQSLKPGAWLYLEDYYLLKEQEALTDEEKQVLHNELNFRAVRPERLIRQQLEAAGFVVERFEDIGQVWSEYAWERSNRILTNYRNQGETGDEVFMQTVNNYGLSAPKILNKVQHIDPEEFQRRFSVSCEYITQWRDYATNPERRYVSSCRVIARKPEQ